MSELVFTRINTKINTSGPIILSMNAAELIVLAQEKVRKEEYINHIFIFRNGDGHLRHRYQIQTSMNIIGVQKSGIYFCFLFIRTMKMG